MLFKLVDSFSRELYTYLIFQNIKHSSKILYMNCWGTQKKSPSKSRLVVAWYSLVKGKIKM